MGGIFMRKVCKRVLFCAVTALVVWTGMLIADRETLNQELIRFHVVAKSDSSEDQAVKLQVRDAVLNAIREDLHALTDVNAAKDYLQEQLPKLQRIANDTLERAGFQPEAVVSLCREAFDTRKYDTFALPAGVYETLRIVIGDGAGHNWWCVAFPSLCMTATTQEFETAAVGAGFSEELTDTLSGSKSYEIRFFLLDQLGRLENILFEG